ncbi:MAG TPA: DUF6079 family protein [Candidatus Cryosericum sp.]|nr:DUF6079 family protein [Candidatus Cryosericum sp.]
MKYKDLVQFEPITSVIQLAGSTQDAERMVSTYVISDGMARQLCDILAPQLELATPAEHKGVFVVGNYGSGKSHLMRVVSAVAEDASLLDKVRSEKVREKFKPFAGQFKVIRSEIGATQMSLRDIVTGYLSEGLEEMGVAFEFPPSSTVKTNKADLTRMMSAFQDKYPGKGLLFVLDELLDYLRARDHQALVMDLSFLREIGEVCSATRFRFVTGVQEMLFGNPSFQFAADQLVRIKDRFEQVRIVREDIAYVVEKRLLRKDESQKSIIRDYITRFEKVFPDIPRRTEEYVELFPVHPEFLSVFERVLVGENRMALQTLSAAMTQLLDQDVPEDHPGLITYDAYWSTLSSNLSLKANPAVRPVFDRVGTIQGRIDGSFPQPLYKPLAVRIVDALAVLRLTTSDADSKVGASSTELRDDLMLYLPDLPQQDPDFLRITVEKVLKDVRTTVGQFIMQNAENGQWYIDVRPGAVDYIAKVDAKAEILSDDEKDQAFYTMLASALELPDATYRDHFRIWQSEIEWAGHKVKRRGYIFLGDPKERSTTQPPLDYYLYFNHVYTHKHVVDDKKPDELFFAFHGRTEDFDSHLGTYAAASDLASRSSGNDQTEYRNIADKARRWLVQQLQQTFSSNFELTYKGQKEALGAASVGPVDTVRELVEAVASAKLSTYFEEIYPDYPRFTMLNASLTHENMAGACANAVKRLAGFTSTEGSAILAGLGLLKGGQVDVTDSPYAAWVQDIVAAKPQGKVITRDELVTDISQEYRIARSRRFALESPLLVVVIAALIHAKGELAIVHPLGRFDATNLKELASMPADQWDSFKHLEKVRVPSPELIKTVLRSLGLPEGLYAANDAEAVRQIVEHATAGAKDLATLDAQFAGGIVCGSLNIYPVEELRDTRAKMQTLKRLLEELAHYDTPAKFANLNMTKDTIVEAFGIQGEVQRLKRVVDTVNECGPLVNYLDAAMNRSTVDEWKQSWSELRQSAVTTLRSEDAASAQRLKQDMELLKHQYVKWYVQQHTKARLGKADDKKKRALLESDTMQWLKELKSISVLPQQKYASLINGLGSLRTCSELDVEELASAPVCPHCTYDPSEAGPQRSLDDLQDDAEALLGDWLKGLQTQLGDPTVAEHVALLDQGQQTLLKEFATTGERPEDASAFVQAVLLALKDMTKVIITSAELVEQVGHNQALTIDEFTNRVQSLLEQKLAGKDRSTVRIIVE